MKKYKPLTWEHAIGLAAPHTWAASVLPVLLGAVLSLVLTRTCRIILFFCTLFISVLMQSAVNTINDYSDFVNKTDTRENSDDPADAILVYNEIDPKRVLVLGLAYLAAAACAGVYVVICTGLVPLLIGICGGLVILLYSFGRFPISRLPIGEAVSGIVMGGLITFAVFVALCGQINLRVLYYSLPLVFGIGMVMLTNNTSDIERDIPGGRKTLPVILGRAKAVLFYRLILLIWILIIAWIVFHDFFRGILLLPLVIICAAFPIRDQMRLPLTAGSRGLAMPGIIRINVILGLGYMAMILVSAFIRL
jgi:1,4-dihydroxy-2-naphthoate polyprenyltransferase